MRNRLIIFTTLLALALGVGWPVRQARVFKASAQVLPGTTVTGTCDCDGFKVTATRINTAAGSCAYQIRIWQTYPTTPPVHVPRGIRLTTTAPVTFQNVVTGTTGMTQTPAVVTSGGTTVQWNSSTQLQNGGSPQLLATITVNPNGVSPQQLTLVWLDEDGVPMCRATLKLECPCRTATAQPNKPSICAGQTTTVTLTPTPQPGAQVTWYKAPMVGGQCPLAIQPGQPPPAGWAVAQVGGDTCNTNVLTQSACYQAVITEGPSCAYTSSVATVYVGQVPNLNSLTVNPAQMAFCKQGVATFTITDPVILANLNNPVFMAAHPNYITWTGSGGTQQNVATYTTQQLTATAASDCPVHIYPNSVQVNDPGCGTQTRSLNVTVWHEPAASAPVATPAGPLCYDQATKVNLPVSCGTVSLWESSTTGPGGPWLPVAGAGSTVNYWTPELLQTTWYRATVANGICPSYVTPALQVPVKPQLSVTLTASGTMLCPGLVTLIAHTPTGYPPPLTYTWFRNGVLVTTTNVPTLSVNQPGNWRVVVTDPACGSAKSNVVRVYPRPVVTISGPCGVCNGKSVTLGANIAGGDPNCPYTYNWTSSAGGGSLGTGQTLTVTPTLAPGASVTYTVTVSCAGCTTAATHTVVRCPP